MIEDLYPEFLATGNSPLLFWELSIAEISDVLQAHNRVKLHELKQQITLNTALAQQIYERIGDLLSSDEDKREFTPVWKLFPGIFDEEKKITEERKKELELQEYKNRFINFAIRYNAGRSGS